MSMGAPGDHPISDLLHWGRNPFPPDMAEMIRQLYALDPNVRSRFALDAYDWEQGKGLDDGLAKLKAELEKHR